MISAKGPASMTDRRQQAITGLTPPQVDEAWSRISWPSVAAYPFFATLGRRLTATIVLAPLGWLVMALPYFLKVLPGRSHRYLLTNRRLVEYRGKTAVREAALADIEDVRVVEDANTAFFRSATLEMVSKGQVAMTLRGVPNAQSFRHAILNACNAWVPGRAAQGEFIPASAGKSR
jgi:hypothetical protein